MKMMRAAGMALAVAFAAAMANPVRAADDIKIGSFVSSTGVMGFMGDAEKKVLETYVASINAKGGVLGRKIDLVIYDDGSQADKAASLAKRLIESDNVDIIIGGTGTPTSMAVIPEVQRAEIPFISLGGGVSITDPVKKWVFKTPHTDRMCAEKVFLDMKKRGISKIAMLSENLGFGKSGHEQSLEAAPKYGIQVIADETYSPKDADVTAQLTKIRATPGVQALFVFGTGSGPAVVSKNIRQLGFTIPIYQSHGVASKDFLKLVGNAADGMRLPADGLVVAVQLPDSDPQKPVVMGLTKVYEDTYHADVSTFGGHAYDGLMIAIDAIKRAGGTDKAKVRDEIEKTKGYVGTAGVVNMSPTDHLGLTLDAFHMLDIKNGDWVLND